MGVKHRGGGLSHVNGGKKEASEYSAMINSTQPVVEAVNCRPKVNYFSCSVCEC